MGGRAGRTVIVGGVNASEWVAGTLVELVWGGALPEQYQGATQALPGCYEQGNTPKRGDAHGRDPSDGDNVVGRVVGPLARVCEIILGA